MTAPHIHCALLTFVAEGCPKLSTASPPSPSPSPPAAGAADTAGCLCSAGSPARAPGPRQAKRACRGSGSPERLSHQGVSPFHGLHEGRRAILRTRGRGNIVFSSPTRAHDGSSCTPPFPCTTPTTHIALGILVSARSQ